LVLYFVTFLAKLFLKAVLTAVTHMLRCA